MTSCVLALTSNHFAERDADQHPGLALVSPTGHVNLANSAFWSMLGRKRQRAALDQFVLPEDRNGFLTVMSDIAQGGNGPSHLMLRFALPDGSVLRTETLVSLVRVNGALEQFIIQLNPASHRLHVATDDQQVSNVTALRPVSFAPDS